MKDNKISFPADFTAEKLREKTTLEFPDGFGTIKLITAVVDVHASWPQPDCPFMWQT